MGVFFDRQRMKICQERRVFICEIGEDVQQEIEDRGVYRVLFASHARFY